MGLARSCLIAFALAAACGSSKIPVSSVNPNKGGGLGGGGGGGGGSDGGVGSGSPDSGTVGGQLPPCYLCGASTDSDAGCPVGLTPNFVSTSTAFVCVCVDDDGGSSCEFCDPSNPQNGGCDTESVCDAYCPTGGYFYLCDPVGQPPADACFADAG